MGYIAVIRSRLTMISALKCALGICFVAGVWAFVRYGQIDPGEMTPKGIRDHVHSWGNLAVLGYMSLHLIVSLSMVIPITPLAFASGLAFGAVMGAVYLMGAIFVSTTVVFLISRYLGRGLLESFLRGKFRDLDAKIEKNGFKTVLFLRLIPVIPYGVFNYLCGLSKIRFKDYFAATFLGLIPSVLIASFYGDWLVEVTGLSDLLSPKFLFATTLLLLRVSIPPVYQFVESRNGRGHR